LIVILLTISLVSVSGQSDSGVSDGEPLHLWFKRSPAQALTTLSFYEPQMDEEMTSDPRFRHVLTPKGDNNSSMVAFFPTHPDNNFLQFEYNSTITGFYNFTISAVLPRDVTDIDFRIRVTMEFAQTRGEEFDDNISFQIEGKADSDRRSYSGEIQIDSDMIEKFDGRKGGRIRVTVERVDDIDTDVLIYCGYRGLFSSLTLPFSKYTYTPDENGEEGFDWTTFLIIVFGSLVIIILVFLAFGIIGGKKEEKKEEPLLSDRRGRRKR
jgi:hypothetical protein